MNTPTVSLGFDDLLLAARIGRAKNEPRPSAGADDLLSRLRFLLAIAQSAAPDAWIQESADQIVSAMLDLQKFQRDAIDPRRRVSLAQAAQMAHSFKAMRQAGHTGADAVRALRERHGLGRSRVYELLALCPVT